MKIKIALLNLTAVLIFCAGCAQDNATSFKTDFDEYKSHFDSHFIDHFPKDLFKSATYNNIFTSRDTTGNDLNLFFYGYGINQNELDGISRQIKDKAIARYHAQDSCLLIINRFETKESKDSLLTPVISDRNLINKKCYTDKYPIPNFVAYKEYNPKRALRLDDTFEIYVLEAKKVKNWGKQFGLGPDPQMPDQWKNGYSKGVAISMQKKTIVYWMVIW